jgi:hypothetical protein
MKLAQEQEQVYQGIWNCQIGNLKPLWLLTDNRSTEAEDEEKCQESKPRTEVEKALRDSLVT